MKRNITLLVILLFALEIHMQAMQIFVRNPTTGTLTLDVEPGDDISNVKAKIFDQTNIATTLMTLKFKATLLADAKTLYDYGILKESSLTLILPSGTGTNADPYQIATLDNLYWLSQTPDIWVVGTFFIQTADIDAAATSGWDSGNGLKPIGMVSSKDPMFNGDYDGKGFTVTNLYVNRPNIDGAGLFGYTQGQLSNIRIIDATIIGYSHVGALVGSGYDIKNCSATGTVTASHGYVGGLVGILAGSYIKLCSAKVTVTNTDASGMYIGGLIGRAENNNPTIKDCYSQGEVTGFGLKAGGFIGELTSGCSLSNSYSTGVVSLIGPEVGGMIGSIFDTNNGGTFPPIVSNCFWDINHSSQANSAGGGIAKTTSEMQTQTTYKDAGWNFELFWSITGSNYPLLDLRPPTYRGGSGELGDPFQIATLYDLVNLSQYSEHWDKFFIQTASINAGATMPPDQSIILNPIGISNDPFTGSFDGQNFNIGQYYQNDIVTFSPLGFFGVTVGAKFKNIHLSNVQITGTLYTGGLVGQATTSTFSNCHVTGAINSIAGAGGFVGYSYNSTFTACSSYVTVTGTDLMGDPTYMVFLGGFVGTIDNVSNFTDCYARGSVSGYKVGGFIGGVDFTSDEAFGGSGIPNPSMGFMLTNCYAANSLKGKLVNGGLYGQSTYTGSAITITNSFWDKDLAGTTDGFIGGTGMITSDMKTKSKFTDAGWDFATVPIWRINPLINNGYPYLKNEFSPNTWNGKIGTAWNNPVNWSNGSVPIAMEDVVIPLVTNNPIVDELSATPAVCNNLTIDPGAVLTINAGKALTVNGNVVSNADVTGLKILSDLANGTGSLKILGSTTAPATVERYMSIDQWHMLSAPAIGKIADFIDLNTDIPVIGVPVTDPITPATYGMMDYNTPEIKWNPYFTKAIVGTDELGIAKGYLVRTIADKGLTITFKGTINAGPATVVVSEGWNCIGNPYTSGININTLAGTESGGDNFIGINLVNLDPNSTGAYIWNDVDRKYDIANLAGGISYAQVGQGFFMKVAAGKSSVTFTPQMQVHQGTAAYKAAIAPYPTIKLIATNNATISSTDIKFIDGTTRGLDVGYDAGIFKSDQPLSLFTKLVEDNGVEFQLQCLPTDQYSNLVIPIGIDSKAAGEIVFSVETVQLAQDCKVILEDKLTNTYTDLSKNSYKAAVVANTAGTGRFFLHTGDMISGLGDQVLQGKLTAYAKGNTEIHVLGEVGNGAVATLYNGLGQVVLTKNLGAGNLNIIGLPNLNSGVYLLNINDKGTTKTIKVMIRK